VCGKISEFFFQASVKKKIITRFSKKRNKFCNFRDRFPFSEEFFPPMIQNINLRQGRSHQFRTGGVGDRPREKLRSPRGAGVPECQLR
jgi:hypothetical protein